MNWKTIPSLNNLYEVTTDGRVRSVKRTLIRSNGRSHTIPGKELTAHPDTKGYPMITAYVKGKRLKCSIRRLVYETHIGSIPKGMVVDHIDGNRTNFNVNNLQLLTRSKNVLKQFEDTYNRGLSEGWNNAVDYFIKRGYISPQECEREKIREL